MNDIKKQIKDIIELSFAEGQKETDITAVFRYINNLFTDDYFLEKERHEDSIRVYTKDVFEKGKKTVWGDNLGWLPNKPLNLYTEKEQKDLLELLLKLNNYELQ